jgi:hypothetical protein
MNDGYVRDIMLQKLARHNLLIRYAYVGTILQHHKILAKLCGLHVNT